jgi:hypothetical protein
MPHKAEYRKKVPGFSTGVHDLQALDHWSFWYIVQLHSLSSEGNYVSQNLGPLRSWQQIADEAFQEKDPEKFKKLSEELEQVLDERSKRLHSPGVPEPIRAHCVA